MKKEKIIITILSIFTFALVAVSTLWPYFKGIDGYTFLGKSNYNVNDTYTYVSFIEQSKQGRILFENLYTSEPQTPTLFRPSYLVLGKVAALLNLSSINVYHISRFALMILFFIVIYKFICRFFENSNERIVCYAIIFLASGFGKTNQVVESITFFSLGEAPHFILSQTLMIAGFGFFLDYLKTKNFKFIGYSSLFFLLLSFEHPFNLVIIASVVFISLLISQFSILTSILITFISSFGILYQYFEVTRNPILAAWQAQNKLLSPTIMDYLLGYGLLVPLAAIGIEEIIGKKEFKYKFILIWVFVTLVSIYLPFPFQRRLIEGFHIPLSILATAGLFYLGRILKKYNLDLFVLVLIALSIGSIYAIKTKFDFVSNPSYRYAFFVGNNELEAINWLGANTSSSDIILANKDYGNIIPGFIGRKTYIGHNIQTINIYKKIELFNLFLKERNIVEANKFTTENGITYIFIGSNDFITQYGFEPENLFLEKVYDKNGVTIYKVIVLKK